MRRWWRIFRVLIFTRPLLLALLGLFYAAAGFLAFVVDGIKCGSP
jgi:hypothetical protein